jgi:hypothetical protein
MFNQYVQSICSINMFNQYVQSICAINMFVFTHSPLKQLVKMGQVQRGWGAFFAFARGGTGGGGGHQRAAASFALPSFAAASAAFTHFTRFTHFRHFTRFRHFTARHRGGAGGFPPAAPATPVVVEQRSVVVVLQQKVHRPHHVPGKVKH